MDIGSVLSTTIEIWRGLVALAIAGVVAVSAATTVAADEPPVGERLRRAWVAHRVDGDLNGSAGAYRGLLEDAEVFADVRARAAIGLALIDEERGKPTAALGWLGRVAELPGVSSRWQIAARRQALRLEASLPAKAPLAQLDREVETLRQESGRLERSAEDASGQLERIERLYGDLRAFVARADDRSPATSDAFDLLESMAAELRETERQRRAVVAVRLERAQRYFRAGRHALALNETKRVLKIDPAHRGAEDLRRRCQAALAATSPRTVALPSFGPSAHGDLVVEMRIRLEEARRHYGAGRISRAISTLDEVLHWYASSPNPLGDDEVSQLIRPAEELRRRCFAETGSPAQAERLSEESRTLRRKLAATTQRLEDQARALDETEEGVAVIRAVAPASIGKFVAAEVERLRSMAERADAAGEVPQAITAYEDLLVWWGWFPELAREVDDERGPGEVERRIESLRAVLRSSSSDR